MKRARNLGSKVVLLALVCFAAFPLVAQDETPFTRLFDTDVVSAQAVAVDTVAKRAGWTLVPEDTVDHPFSGDAVLLNDKLAVVLRKLGRGAEVYSKTVGGLKHRATVGYVNPSLSKLPSLEALKIIENNSGAVMVEVSFKGASPSSLRFRLTTGEAILEIRPGESVGYVNVESKTRYVVVPDYFGDDAVFGASAPPSQRGSRREEALTDARGKESLLTSAATTVMGTNKVYLPAENLCLHLLDGGDAIMMAVWKSSQQDVTLSSDGPGQDFGSCASAIQCLKGKSVWLAFLEGQDLWHAGNGRAKDDWQPPFSAKWRYCLLSENSLAESWTSEKPDGTRPGRTADFSPLPPDQPTVKRTEVRAPNASLLVYPIDRSAATPLTVTCPTDVMRNTLGVGPCQYILACEGLAAQGDPTPNAVMNWVEKLFEQKKEQKMADDIEERLELMSQHVAQARTRIHGYAAFSGQIRKLFTNPEVSAPFLPVADDLDRSIAIGLSSATSPERATQLAHDVAALIGKENSLAACQRLGEQLRSIGAAQDRSLAKCRMAVRRLLAESKTVVARQPSLSSLASEIQRLAEQKLQNK